jgi:tetratricopeptide (TPR) repeat protein
MLVEFHLLRFFGRPVLTFLILATLYARGAQAVSADVGDLLRVAEQAARSGNAEQAADLYRQVLQIKPHWIPAEFDLALAYHFQRKYSDAIALFTDVVRRDPSIANAYWFRGLDYYQIGQYRKALASLERTLELQPAHSEARFYIAASYFLLGDHRRAASAYAEQIQLHPESEDAYFQLIQCYEVLRDSALAQIDEDIHASYFVLLLEAESDLEQGDISSAEVHTRLAMQSDSAAPEAWLVLGQQAERDGKPADARAAFENAQQKNKSLSARFQGIADTSIESQVRCIRTADLAKALCHASRGDLAGSTSAILAATTPDLDNARTLYWTIQIYTRLIQLTAAKLAVRFPHSAGLHKLYARAYEKKGQRSQAEQEYEKAVALDGQDASTFIEYANFRSRGQEFELAIGLLKKAFTLTPDDSNLEILLGYAFVRHDEPAQAVPYLAHALKAEPRDEQLRLDLAQSLHTLDRIDEAVAILEGAPADPDGRISYMLGTYYALHGEKEKALQAMRIFQKRRQQSSAGPR